MRSITRSLSLEQQTTGEKGGFVYLSLNASCSYPDVEVRVDHALRCCSGDGVQLGELRVAEALVMAKVAHPAVLLDASQAQPGQELAHHVTGRLAILVDCFGTFFEVD